MPITVSEAPGTLPAAAKKIYVSAFNGAYEGTCKDPKKRRGGGTRDECAAKIAWSAVKRKYKQVGDKWVAKSILELIDIGNIARATVADATTTNLPHGTGGYLPHGSQYDGKRKCPKCGVEVGADAKKCPKCGAKMEDKTMDKTEILCVKSLGEDRIGGYLALWGDEDTKDLVGEFFSPETDFWLGTWGSLPALYHHGYNPELRGFKSIVGTWDTFKKDHIGLWVEGELKKHHEYREAIDRLISEKSMYLSSGALPKPGYIDIEENGHIKSWAVIEGSLTPTPMEHRLANIDFLKSTIDLGAIDARKEAQMSTNEEVKSLWEKMGDAFGFRREKPLEAEPAEETEMPEDVKAFLEGITTQVATSVAEAFNKALVEMKATVESELDEMKATISEFDGRLSGTEKSIEEKVAEKFESLPPIVTAPVTRVAASVKGDDDTVPVVTDQQKTGSEFVDDIVGGIVDGILGNLDSQFVTPQLEVLAGD